MMSERTQNIFMAKLSGQAERFDDMLFYMKAVVKQPQEMNMYEMDLFTMACKSVIEARRVAIRSVNSMESEVEPHAQQQVDQYKAAIQMELTEKITDILHILDKYYLSETATLGSKVFYYKMKGDYNRYLVELQVENEPYRHYLTATIRAYVRASKYASSGLPEAHPQRLSLALNYSVFYSDYLNKPTIGLSIAKTEYKSGIDKLDDLPEDLYKDAVSHLRLLRDNIRMWEKIIAEAEAEAMWEKITAEAEAEASESYVDASSDLRSPQNQDQLETIS
mmetsp:Transcript_48590/g.94975  ORF Transcript_48590/g.94975 Transcript_48590/m.94975 type:complete len:278 (-) Transcript_48590:11-844(-)